MNPPTKKPRRRDPVRRRPGPKGYFAAGEDGMLAWSHVVQELRNARNYWIATASAEGRANAARLAVPLADVLEREQPQSSTSFTARRICAFESPSSFRFATQDSVSSSRAASRSIPMSTSARTKVPSPLRRSVRPWRSSSR